MTTAIFDLNRTLYNPVTNTLVDGARELLEALKHRGVRLVLISRKERDRESLLETFGLHDFFERVMFVEDKTEALFRALADEFVPVEEIYVIGDYRYEEIRFGNCCGMKTIWFRSGKFADLFPECFDDLAWYTITRLEQALDIIVTEHP